MSKYFSKNFLILLMVTLGAVEGLLYAYTMKPTDDPMQLFTRGIELAALGHWTHFGAAVTGGGFVPGSLTTALIGGPLWLWDSPYAYELTLLLLQLCGLYFYIKAIERQLTPPEALAFLAYFWLTPWRASFAILWNPGYLFLASGLHLYTGSRMAQQRSFQLSFWHAMAIVVAFQLHASFALLAFVTLYLIVRKMIQVDWRGFAAATVLGICSLIPYFLALAKKPQIAPVLDPHRGTQFYYGRGFIEVAQLAKAIYYWPRYTSAIFPNYIFNWVHFDNPSIAPLEPWLSRVFLFVRYGVGIPSLAFSICAFGWLLQKFYVGRHQEFAFPNFLDNYLFGAVLATLVAAALSPAEFSSWHLLVFMPLANIHFVRWLFQCWPARLARHGWTASQLIAIFCCYFVVYNAAIVFISDEHSFSNNMHVRYSELKSKILRDSHSNFGP